MLKIMNIAQNYKFSGIYCIINTINGKKYIGSSKNIYNRWLKHRATLRGNYHGNPHLQSAWNKYGEKSFHFFIIEKCNPMVLEEREDLYINSIKPEYNMQGAVRHSVSEEIRQHIKEGVARARAEGRLHSNIGQKLSAEHIAKLPQNQKGYKCLKRQKGVYIYTLDFKFVCYFGTLKEAAQYIGVTFKAISYALVKSKRHICKQFYLTRIKL